MGKMGKHNHTAYHIMKNDQSVPEGRYKGKWSGYFIETEDGQTIFTDISSRGIDVPVQVTATKQYIKIYLRT